MRARAEHERIAIERDVAHAWWIENFARTGNQFKGLSHYLNELKPKKQQTATDILAVFQEHRRRGAAIRIRHIKPGEE